eukprot:555413-Alexandrium_andersonii.AAC.1
MTGLPDPGASPRPRLRGPHTWASARPSLWREVGGNASMADALTSPGVAPAANRARMRSGASR